MLLQRLLSLCDPCFLFRPQTLIQACIRKMQTRPSLAKARAAWGDLFEVDPGKFIGAHLYMRGVHELPVCETLFRLTEIGEAVADIGANIGVMTSLLSRRVGLDGHVLSVEAHPHIIEQLKRNIAQWSRSNIEIIHAAVSDKNGSVMITENLGFHENEGTARISEAGEECIGEYQVKALTLDQIIGTRSFGLIKIDVEGHEFEVLKGAQKCLSDRRIRDIVFETTAPYPNPSHDLLLAAGYEIRRIETSCFGVHLTKPQRTHANPEILGDFLATLDLKRAESVLRPRGWRVLKAQSPSPDHGA